MAETTNNPPPAAVGEGGGPPSDLGNSPPVVIEKANAAPPSPAAPPPAAVVPPVKPAVEPVAKPPVAKTIADDPPPAEPEKPVAATWPDNWRELMAGDDKKELARLQRMNSPLDVKNSWRAMEQRLSSGELKRALPNNPTAEELAAYRESNGIPGKPEDYDVNLGNGFVWGEADKPLLDDFRKFAHENNIPNDMLKPVLGWFTKQQQEIADQVAQRDENERVTGSEALRAEWGAGFKGNLAASRNLFEGQSITTADGKAADAFLTLMGARAEDGRLLGNIPDVVKMFANISREMNPFATVVPDQPGGSPIKSAETRFGELNAMMRDKGSAYYRGAQKDNLQAEWRELHTMLEKAKGRAA